MESNIVLIITRFAARVDFGIKIPFQVIPYHSLI
jgi:hypothetical protein